MKLARAAGLAALLLTLWIGSAVADDVTLTSRDGSVEISGTLLGYDGEFYRVDTVYGELTLDGSGVICEGPGCPDLEAFIAEIEIAGARTMGAVLMPALLESFAARNGYLPERVITSDTDFRYRLIDRRTGNAAADITFRVTSTEEGFADLLADDADLVLALREARTAEVRMARDAGLGNLAATRRSHVVALDALVPLVSARNPVRAITMPDLAAAFSGAVTNWSDLGGQDRPVSLHLREDNSGLVQAFVDRVLGPAGLELAGTVTRHQTNDALSDAVSGDPAALGIGAFSELGNAEPLTILGSCGMPTRASDTTVKTEDYPLNAPLFIYTPARRLPLLAREFLAYVRSSAAQPVIRRAGFVDQQLRTIDLNEQGDRLANAVAAAGEETSLETIQRMVRQMRSTQRLTLTFRFKTGGSALDAQSRSNVSLLARVLESGAYNDRSLAFVGFTDGDGSAETNQRLARRRAVVVRDAVLQAAAAADRSRLRVRVEAFGEAMPMACDEDDWGRRVNRRVEVWVGQR